MPTELELASEAHRHGAAKQPRYMTTMQMSLELRAVVCLLAQRLGVSRAAVTEMAVRQLARRRLNQKVLDRILQEDQILA